MSGDILKAVQVHPLNFHHYPHQTLHAGVAYIVDLENLLCFLSEANCSALTESFWNYMETYALGMKTVYLSTTANSERAGYSMVIFNVDDIKFLKEVYCTAMLKGRHWRRTVEALKGEDSVERAAEPLRI